MADKISSTLRKMKEIQPEMRSKTTTNRAMMKIQKKMAVPKMSNMTNLK